MIQHFAGWDAVAKALRDVAQQQLGAGAAGTVAHLNEGQCASLLTLAERITDNGVIIADEVGMGKTRIATTLARCVVEAGGRVAVLIPPGLGFQWQSEMHASKLEVPAVLRGLPSYHQAWQCVTPGAAVPWFDEPVLLISHLFSNWRLSASSERSSLLPELIARWRKRQGKAYPPGYDADAAPDNFWGGPAAISIVKAIPQETEHAAYRFLEEVDQTFTWTQLRDGEHYTKHGLLRESLERAVGLGLGRFDLVIIDEAHKGRQLDSGLSTVLDRVLLSAPHTRRIGLTATPVELDVDLWWNTLARIGIDEQHLGFARADENNPIQSYAKAVQNLRKIWRTSASVRETYKLAAKDFTAALSPFLLRRDKREDPAVQRFVDYTKLPFEHYRRHGEVVVDPTTLSTAWRQAICAAESLSLIAAQSEASSHVGRRLRLTIGNGHGISSLIDQHQEDAVEDAAQRAHDAQSGEAPEPDGVPESESIADVKREARRRWWSSVIARAFAGNEEELLFDHPAILAAVDSIEASTREGEKVLVFGRYTRPLQALVSLLNAREMLRHIRHEKLWPQSKVHGEAGAGTGEWPAVRTAYRQLYGRAPTQDEERGIDATLATQYRRLERQRQRFRDSLIDGLERAFADPALQQPIPRLGRGSAIVAAFRRAVEQSDDNDDLNTVARAIGGLVAGESADDSTADPALAQAFLDLVRSATTRDGFDAADTDNRDEDERAASLWSVVMERVREEYTRPEGGFARLMNGPTQPESRRMLQVAFNRHASYPNVLVAQSVVGREGLNLHEVCRTVLLLHPEWNPGVVEQQIGRVDRVGSHWSVKLERAIEDGTAPEHVPRIEVRAVIFTGTYDEENWRVLRERWDDLRAQLHGIPVPARLAGDDEEARAIIADLCEHAPDFSPSSVRRRHGRVCD